MVGLVEWQAPTLINLKGGKTIFMGKKKLTTDGLLFCGMNSEDVTGSCIYGQFEIPIRLSKTFIGESYYYSKKS